MRRLALAVAAFAASLWSCSPARAQSTCPPLAFGVVLTAGQWNSCFTAKQDVLGFTPLNRAGGTMLGKLITQASTNSAAGFNIQTGIAPGAPLNGDLWVTTAGLFVRVNGSTVGPLISASSPCLNCALTTDPNNFSVVQKINLTGGALATPLTGTLLQASSGSSGRFQIDAYGGAARLTSVSYGGSFGAPAATASGAEMSALEAWGHNGSAVVGPRAALRLFASQTWAVGANGTFADVAVTPNGTATLTQVVKFENSTGITVPGTVTGGDKGAGTINAVGLYVGGVAVLTTNPSTTLTGDVTGTGTSTIATTVARINGVTLGSTAATAGNLLVGSGTQWITQAMSGDGALSSAGALTVSKISGNAVTLGGALTTTGTGPTTLAFPNGAAVFTLPGATATLAGLGTNQTFSGTDTFSGTLNVSGAFQIGGTAVALPISLANGGTNAALAASNGGVVYSTATAFAVLAGTGSAGQCLLSGATAPPTWGSCAGGAAVSSVTAANASLTISPTTGAVLASLNLANANTWTAKQTISGAGLALTGNITAAAWTTAGIKYANVAGTLTDSSSSGTVATAYTSVFGGNTIAASSSTTFTNYYGAYFAAETAGTNVTFTNVWGMGADSARFGTSNQVRISAAGHVTVEGVTSTGATGTGAFVFDGTPTLITPVLGVATATSINKVAITAPATSATLTIANGKTLAASASLTLAGTDGVTATFFAANDTVAGLGTTQTFTRAQTFNVATTLASATAAALDDVNVQAATATITGNTGSPITRLAKVGVYRPTLTDASAVTVTDAASLYVDNSPLAAGSVTITNAWAILVGAGNVKFSGTANSLGTITSGTWNGAVVGGTYGGTGVNNGASTITVGGNLATAGAASLPTIATGDLWHGSATGIISGLADVATGSVLASGGVATAPAWSAAPTLTTSLTTPIVIGGTATSSTLTLRSTSGAGATDQILMQTASQVSRLKMISSGFTILGDSTTPTPGYPLVIYQSSASGQALMQFINGTTGSTAADGAYFGVVGTDPTFRITQQENAGVQIATNGVNAFLVTATPRIGFITISPSYDFAFDGQAARQIGIERHLTTNTAGNGLTLSAGGATSGATNKAGGSLTLIPGVSTGSGASSVVVQAYQTSAGATSDNSASTVATFNISGTTLNVLSTDAAQSDNTLCINSSNLVLKGSGTLGVCLGTSSARYKQAIEPMRAGLREVRTLAPKQFNYRRGWGDDGARVQFGFLAEDVESVLPTLTGLDAEGRPNTVDLLGMLPVALRAIQEVADANDARDRRIAALEAEAAFLRAANGNLRQELRAQGRAEIAR